jgi:hypothetical protein
MDVESTERMVILLGFTSSGMRSLPEEWDSTRNYQIIDEKSTEEWIPLVITSSWNLIQTGKIKMQENNNFRISNSKSSTLQKVTFIFKNCNTKASLKLNINLIRPYDKPHSYLIKSKTGQQNLVRPSLS